MRSEARNGGGGGGGGRGGGGGGVAMMTQSERHSWPATKVSLSLSLSLTPSLLFQTFSSLSLSRLVEDQPPCTMIYQTTPSHPVARG